MEPNAARSLGELARGAVILSLTAPPYQRIIPLAPFGNADPPLGAVILVAGAGVLVPLACVPLVLRLWPWVVPGVVLPISERLPAAGSEPFLAYASRIAFVRSARGPASMRDVLRAVAERPAPGARDLALWTAMRLRGMVPAIPLEEQFARALGEIARLPRSSSSYSRAFHKFPAFSARDWRAVGQLVRSILATRNEPAGAANAGPRVISELTAHRRVARYLKMSPTQAGALMGWEWVLERALRVAGFRPAATWKRG